MKRSPMPPRKKPMKRTGAGKPLYRWHPGLGPSFTGARRPPEVENGVATWHRTRIWVLDRAKGRCEARIEGVCTGRGEHVHHLILRSRGGPDEPWNLVALCHRCHGHIHDHPKWSTENGWIRSRAA